MRELQFVQLEKENESLKAQNKSLIAQNKNLNEKYQEMLEKNFKSQRAQDLEPIFKPIHSKTMSLVGMLKQYATAGVGNNDATERVEKAFQPQKGKEEPPKANNRYVSPANKNEDLSDLSEEYYSDFGSMGFKKIDDLKAPDLPKNDQF